MSVASTSDLAETKETSAESSDLSATATGENSPPFVTTITAWKDGSVLFHEKHDGISVRRVRHLR